MGILFVVMCALVGGTLAGTVAGVGEFFDEDFTPAPDARSALIQGMVPGTILGGFLGVVLTLLGKRYFGR